MLLTRQQQLAMVVFGHGIILVGVILIMRFAFGPELADWPPATFIVFEIAIIVMCWIGAFTDPKPLWDALERVLAITWLKERVERRSGSVARGFQAAALLSAYGFQFAALIPLLSATGGPIDSPFAQMALAIAIFTPVIINKVWTVLAVILTTMIYYGAFVEVYGFSDANAPRPAGGSFVAVNLLILVLASILTFRYQAKREGPALDS